MGTNNDSLEKNKALALSFFKAINEKNLDKFDELCGEDYVWHGEAGPTEKNEVRGRDNFKKAVAEFTEALPDLQIIIDDIIAEGDKVALRFHEIGTHTGADFAGIKASGKSVTWTCIGLYRIADGRLVEEWFNEDSLGILQQLGGL